MSQSHLDGFPPLDGLKLWHLLQSQMSGDALKVNFDPNSPDLLMHRNIHGVHNMQDMYLNNEEQRMKMNHHHIHNDKAHNYPDKKSLDNSTHLNSHSSHHILHQPNQHHGAVLRQPSGHSSALTTINCSVCHKKIRNSKKQQQTTQKICDKCSRSQKNLYNHNNIHDHSNNAHNHQQQNSMYSHNSQIDYQFSSHTVNDSHLSAHPCKVCKRGFLFKHDLDRHEKASRGECGKQFKCDKCSIPRYFSNGGNLKRHMMLHSGEKPYSCMVCNKAFRTKTLLENHIRTHTGEKPFICMRCDKKFGKAENLKRHSKIHAKC